MNNMIIEAALPGTNFSGRAAFLRKKFRKAEHFTKGILTSKAQQAEFLLSDDKNDGESWLSQSVYIDIMEYNDNMRIETLCKKGY